MARGFSFSIVFVPTLADRLCRTRLVERIVKFLWAEFDLRHFAILVPEQPHQPSMVQPAACGWAINCAKEQR